MEPKAEHKEKIDQLITHTKCAYGFECCKSGFTKLCRAKDIGIDGFLECYERSRLDCGHFVNFGDSRFCKCPVRVYIAKVLGK